MAKPAPWDYPFLKKEQPLRDTRDSLDLIGNSESLAIQGFQEWPKIE